MLAVQALGLLFLAGATIGLVSLILPHPAQSDTPGLYSNVALAYVGGAALLLGARHIRAWLLHLALLAGALLITRAVFLSGEAVSFYSVWFIWVALYAFYFFGRKTALGYFALCAALYAFSLAHRVPSSPVARWLTTVATLLVAGGFIDTLVRRSRRDATRAAATAEHMAKIASAAVELAAISRPDAARRALCQAASELTGAASVALWEATGGASFLEVSGLAGECAGSVQCPVTRTDVGAVQAFLFGSAAADPVVAEDAVAPEFAGAAPGAVCRWQPVADGANVLAVVAFLWHDPAAATAPALAPVLDLIVAQVKVTLERVTLLARLQLTARTDELTGLPNRRAWQEVLPEELTRSRRSGEPLCVALLDLDHFKRYNDTRGHQAGDRLLKEVAVSWSSELRASDILARYGGEEFALALPACPLPQALEVVERLREVTPAGQTCSAGVAVWSKWESAAAVFGRADAALYEAKRTGRNQTVVAPMPAVDDEAGGAGLGAASLLDVPHG